MAATLTINYMFIYVLTVHDISYIFGLILWGQQSLKTPSDSRVKARHTQIADYGNGPYSHAGIPFTFTECSNSHN